MRGTTPDVPAERIIRVGTRGSPLARRQTDAVLAALRQRFPDRRFEARPLRTSGDRRARAPLDRLGGVGVFVKELESALLAGEIDMAVHSLKDVPTAVPEGLTIAAVVEREDPRDALVSRSGAKLTELPPGARVGTGSPRRACQLRALRPDIEVVGIRGNVDTRLRKVAVGEMEAVVMAAAALARMGWLGRASEVLSFDVMLPAPGQGALAIEVRDDDEAARQMAEAVDERDCHRAATAERAFLRRLGGGCAVPIASLGSVEGGRLRLRGLVGDAMGRRILRAELQGPADDAEVLGVRLAERLLSEGAGELLEEST
jgi:hydroxymethylbilane synthase